MSESTVTRGGVQVVTVTADAPIAAAGELMAGNVTPSTSMTYWPFSWTHTALGLIWAVTVIGLTAVEFYFLWKMGVVLDDTGIFFIVLQNIGIGIANAYWATNISLTASGLQETTGKTTPPSP